MDMVGPYGTPPDQPGLPPYFTPPVAPPPTGYTVPGGWGSPPAPRMPGTVVAAAVITYIRAGLGIVGSGLLVIGGSLIADLGVVWAFIAAAVFVVCVLYIVAALLLQLRRNRAFLLWLTIIDIALSAIILIDSLARAAGGNPAQGGGNLCSLILPAIVLSMLRHGNTLEWIDAYRSEFGPRQR
jgi:hypothetical protein